MCFSLAPSPAGRVFCVFVFWPHGAARQTCVLCFRVLRDRSRGAADNTQTRIVSVNATQTKGKGQPPVGVCKSFAKCREKIATAAPHPQAPNFFLYMYTAPLPHLPLASHSLHTAHAVHMYRHMYRIQHSQCHSVVTGLLSVTFTHYLIYSENWSSV